MFAKRLILIACLTLPWLHAEAGTVENIRVWSENGKTRVVLDLSGPSAYVGLHIRF